MWRAFYNTLKVKELRNRLLFTALIIVIVRVASTIPCPGVDMKALDAFFSSQKGKDGLMAMIDLFSGGALTQFALGALGIMPYITASIIMQLLVPVLPQLEKMQREGESGRQKISQYTRYLTILVCLIQGAMAAFAIINPDRIGLHNTTGRNLFVIDQKLFVVITMLVLTATTMVFTWLGEQITERGIGNGVSLIITINIVSRLPQAIGVLINMTAEGTPRGDSFNTVHLLLMIIVFCIVTAATILLSQGYRRVPIQMVRKTVGKQMMGGSTYMPLKVNFANVMPIIFAGAILMLPEFLFREMARRPDASEIWGKLYQIFQHNSLGYIISYGVLILLFSFFWVANQFNPLQIADNLKKEGAYIPGISPGQPTADFLDSAMTRVTAGGAVFLLALALFPMFLYNQFHIPFIVAQFFGGTSLMIMVGVVLETMSQLESHLTMRHYEGFLKSGRLRNRSGN